MTDQIETHLREMFGQQAAEVPPESIARLFAIDNHLRPRLSQRLILRTAGAGAAIAAGAAAAIIFTAGGTPNAFAEWRAEPTPAASGQVQTAESECQRNSALVSRTPAVVDTRGPYTLLVYTDASGVGLCVTGPSFNSPTGQPPFAPFRDGGVSLTASDAIRRTDTGSVLTKTSPMAEFDFNAGRVGADVSAVEFVLENGSRVQATVANGWFAVDWPGNQQAVTAEITTTGGTSVDQRMPTSEPGA
jgi:hypothetical protein